MAENYWSREDDNEELDPIGWASFAAAVHQTRNAANSLTG